MDDPNLRTLFDAVYEATKDAKRTVAIILTQLLGYLNAAEKTIAEGPSPDALLELIRAIDAGTISGNAGKEVLRHMVESDKAAPEIIREEGLQQIADSGAIEELVKKAIAANPQAIESYKQGKQAALGAIVGWVMKETKGQADPVKLNEMLRKFLTPDPW